MILFMNFCNHQTKSRYIYSGSETDLEMVVELHFEKLDHRLAARCRPLHQNKTAFEKKQKNSGGNSLV